MTDRPTTDEAKKGDAKSRTADDVTNLVNGLFEEITNELTVHEKIRQTLSDLRGTYLKLAHDTPNLFAIENHQARLFLTSALKTSSKWDQERDPKYSYIKKLESVVNTIINLKKYDNNVFIKAGNDLEKQIGRIEKLQNIKIKREKEKSTGQNKILLAKHNTKNILIEKMSGKTIPLFAKEILLSEWFNVLVLLNLRCTITSEEYQEKLNFVDQLISYSQKKSQNAINESQINKLAENYKKGLLLVAFNPTDSEKKYIELRNNLVKINLTRPSAKVQKTKTNNEVDAPIKIENPSIQATHMKPSDVLKISQFQKQPKPQLTKQKVIKTSTKIREKQEKNDYNKIVTSLAKGTWFEFSNQNGSYIKAKLSWISPISEKYLFVDSNGIKLSDKTKLEMIEGIKNKSIRILNTFT